jgi:hypothetical protein
MGLLFTTEATRRVVNTLNTAFDGPSKDPINNPTGLDAIRKIAPTGSKLANKIALRDWKPGRLARMLLLLPYDQSGQQNPLSDGHTKRWHYFLKTVVGSSTDKGSVFATLQNALADAILNTATDSTGAALDIVRVSFDHVELADNANMDIVIFDAPVKSLNPSKPPKVARHITLFTATVPEKNPNGTPLKGTPFDGPDSDLPDPSSTGLNATWADPNTDPWNNNNP